MSGHPAPTGHLAIHRSGQPRAKKPRKFLPNRTQRLCSTLSSSFTSHISNTHISVSSLSHHLSVWIHRDQGLPCFGARSQRCEIQTCALTFTTLPFIHIDRHVSVRSQNHRAVTLRCVYASGRHFPIAKNARRLVPLIESHRTAWVPMQRLGLLARGANVLPRSYPAMDDAADLESCLRV